MDEASGSIFNVMRYSVDDGPGIRTTVFLKGCPLSCWWCHNPEGRSFDPEPMYLEDRCRHCGDCVAACPEHAIEATDGEMRAGSRCRRCGTCVAVCAAGVREIAGRRTSAAAMMADIERDLVFFDESGGGVTLSGGEPLSQPRFAEAILDACRRLRIHSTIETCGFASRDTFLRVAERADLVLFDLKLIDREKHERYTGAPNDPILANLRALGETGRPAVARIPVIPGINDGDADVRGFIECLSETRIGRVQLLPYHASGVGKWRRLGVRYRLDGVAPPPAETMRRIGEAFSGAGFAVKIGGAS